MVCDGCNNYLARKIEKPLLETHWFRHARSRQGIESKRGHVPPMSGLVPAARLPANVWLDGERLSIGGLNERDNAILLREILAGRASSVYIPIIDEIDERLMSRFLAKVAIEMLAYR